MIQSCKGMKKGLHRLDELAHSTYSAWAKQFTCKMYSERTGKLRAMLSTIIVNETFLGLTLNHLKVKSANTS